MTSAWCLPSVTYSRIHDSLPALSNAGVAICQVATHALSQISRAVSTQAFVSPRNHFILMTALIVKTVTSRTIVAIVTNDRIGTNRTLSRTIRAVQDDERCCNDCVDFPEHSPRLCLANRLVFPQPAA